MVAPAAAWAPDPERLQVNPRRTLPLRPPVAASLLELAALGHRLGNLAAALLQAGPLSSTRTPKIVRTGSPRTVTTRPGSALGSSSTISIVNVSSSRL